MPKSLKKNHTVPNWLQTLLEWFSDHGLLVMAAFLLAFIPLYPKIPIYSPIEQYNVRVRIEDFLILLTFGWWGWQWLRQKVSWKSPLTTLILAYLVVGLLSVLSAAFLIKTVPLELLHLGKTSLHYLRYLEYFTLFFITFSAIKSKRDVKILFGVLVLTVALIIAYGYGQKFFYWPVYSTMNREFSKGIRLYLTEHARVQSTFAGHYDLSAYLVLALPILLAAAFQAKNWITKIGLHFIHWAGIWLLVVSAARSSFGAYVVASSLVVALLAWKQKTWKSKLGWGSSRLFFLGLLVSTTFLYFGQDIYDRFLQVLDGYPEASQAYHQTNSYRKLVMYEYAPALIGLDSWPSFNSEIPENSLSTDQASRIIVRSDQQPVRTKPADAYVDVPDLVEVEVATISASGSATTTTTVIEQERIYSECSKQKGLSLCIRLESLWPQAIAGLTRNPLVGSGYATLNKADLYDFTEADSTDNNFLRTLGETGLLGFITFYGAITLGMWVAWKGYLMKDSFLTTLAVGYFSGALGLLLNAVYIDVFASSKVAYTFWALTGLLMAYYYLVSKDKATLGLKSILKKNKT